MGNQRKTIVALHGAGMTGAVFGGMAPHLLEHSFRALTFPGHDVKSGTGLLPDIAGMAAWVKSRLENGPDDVVLLGHSMGALVALAACDAPQVKGIVLLGAAAKMPVNADLLKTAVDAPNDAIGMIVKWGIFAGHPQVGAVRTVLSSIMHAANPDAVGVDLAACNNFKDGETLAKTVKIPALVISGDQDKMVKTADAQAFAQSIAGAEFGVLKDCGHTPMVEKPIDTAQVLRDFISVKIS